MGYELDFGSHDLKKSKGKDFRALIHTIWPSNHNVYGRQLFVPKLSLA